MDPSVIVGEDGIARCWWATTAPEFIPYHDGEWGFPVDDDRVLFEKLSLEGFQSGLSWLTILRKRPAFRRAFDDFDFSRIAGYEQRDVDRLLQDEGIVRHRGKIESTINNSRRALELIDEWGSLGSFFWSFEPDPEERVVDTKTPESTAMAKALKKRGFSFVGPTTCYAFMEAMGIVNDHLPDCDVWQPVEDARRTFTRPAPS